MARDSEPKRADPTVDRRWRIRYRSIVSRTTGAMQGADGSELRIIAAAAAASAASAAGGAAGQAAAGATTTTIITTQPTSPSATVRRTARAVATFRWTSADATRLRPAAVPTATTTAPR